MPASASSRTHRTRTTSSSSNSSSSSWKPYDRRCPPSAGSPPNTRSRDPNRTRSIPRVKVSCASPVLKRHRQQRVASDIQLHHSAEAGAGGRQETDADTNVDDHPAYGANADADKPNIKSEPGPTTIDPPAEGGPEAEAEADTQLDHPGLPTYATYKRIEADYLRGLSPRKRDKALVTQVMFDKIWDVLHQPEACSIETPQFRFWVRKMFTLVRPAVGGGTGAGAGADESESEGEGSTGTGMGMGIGWASMNRLTHPDSDSESDDAGLELERTMGIGRTASANELLLTAVVLHDNRPVAIQEQLYELLCYCHVRAGHGGRDKTCAVIRKYYSWVPKELTAQFVKACPTCVRKKSGQAGYSIGLVHKRESGREKRGRVKVAAEEMPVSIVPSSFGSAEWPAIDGLLELANPQSCGAREPKGGMLRAHEEAKPVGQSSLVSSPVHGRGTRPLPNVETCVSSGWGTSGVPRTLVPGASPSTPCDATRSIKSPPPLAMGLEHRSRSRDDWEGNPRKPTKGLPSLANTLSSDDSRNLSGLESRFCDSSEPGNSVAATGECPPSARMPWCSLGPITASSDIEPDPPLVGSPSLSSYLFHLDPILLSFDYPDMPMGTWGLGTTTSGLASYWPDTGAMPLSFDLSMSMSMSADVIMGTETMSPYDREERRVRDSDPVLNPTRSPGLLGLYDRLRALSSDLDELDIPDEDLGLDRYVEGKLDVSADAESRDGLETPELDRSMGSVDFSEDSSSDGSAITRTYEDTDKSLRF